MSDAHLDELRREWDGRADRELDRETVTPAKQVHTDLIRREIDRCVAGREGLRILDAGAGPGRFSVPLARAGHRVVHLDLSPRMLELARARAEGVEGIVLVEGSITDLSRFANGSFDLVLCIDSPLSFCVDEYEEALDELTRVASGTLVLCVIGRTAVTTEGADFDLKHFGRLRTVPEVFRTGTLRVTEDLRRLQPELLSSWHGFTVEELTGLLDRRGFRVTRVSAPGAFSRNADPELLRALFEDEDAYADYLDFEEEFDAEAEARGLSTTIGGGLMVTAVRA